MTTIRSSSTFDTADTPATLTKVAFTDLQHNNWFTAIDTNNA
ncbi:hypothetical protein [Loigolactobacillus backii]|nr:hypothetical protein [Loigolactobacillus backii]MDA5386484.1 hypothetical protein [Loigolactobacillus backii]